MTSPALDSTRFLSFTVVAEPLDITSAAVASLFRQFTLSKPMLRSEENLDLERLYRGSPPHGGAHPHKVVLYAPASDPDSTVMVTNLQDGWSSVSCLMADRLGAKQAKLIATDSAAEYPQVYLQAWMSGVARAIMCMRDSHAWVFHTVGDPLPFEDLAVYSARKVSRRFTRELALDYVRAMGWNAATPEFWLTEAKAVYFEQATLN